MRNEILVLIIFLFLITGFCLYLLFKNKDGKSLRNSIEKQNELIRNQFEKREDKDKEKVVEPVYVPVIYGANVGRGDLHRPYWGRYWRRR